MHPALLRPRHGFSLFETVVVVIILGIVSATTIYGFQTLFSDSRSEAALAEARAFESTYRDLVAVRSVDLGFELASAEASLVAEVLAASSFASTTQYLPGPPGKVEFSYQDSAACLTLPAGYTASATLDPSSCT